MQARTKFALLYWTYLAASRFLKSVNRCTKYERIEALDGGKSLLTIRMGRSLELTVESYPISEEALPFECFRQTISLCYLELAKLVPTELLHRHLTKNLSLDRLLTSLQIKLVWFRHHLSRRLQARKQSYSMRYQRTKVSVTWASLSHEY